MTTYFAKHILLDNGEILHDGALSVADGLITNIGTRSHVAGQTPHDRAVNLGDILLLPGFINIHTHLEESPIRGCGKELDETYASWSSKKYSRMRQLTDNQIRTAIKLSAREMLSQGITTIVDSSRTGISADVLAQESIRSVVIAEIPNAELLDEGIERVKNLTANGASLKYGIGPYALYSLDTRAHRKLIEYTYDTGCLWMCHIAESAEELQAYCEQSGDFYFNLTRQNEWFAKESRLDPVQYALAENLIPSHGILVHCNYVNTYSLSLLAAKRVFVTLCCKYGAEMGHKSFPVEAACNRGVQICLGTEGLAATGYANLFDDLFQLKCSYPHITALELLRWVTKNPAAALRVSDKLGSLSVGKFADVIGVRFPYDADADLLETLLVSEPEIDFVMVGGEEIIT